MEMLNHAIEDASDFEEFKRKLTRPKRIILVGRQTGKVGTLDDMVGVPSPRTLPSRRPGENREQYRARVYGHAK